MMWVWSLMGLWLVIGALAAARAWRRGELDVFDDGMVSLENGVVDKTLWAALIVMLGPATPLGDFLGALNDRTKPSRRNTR